MTDALALAQSLISYGISPLPVIARTKRAALKWARWQADGIESAQLPLLFKDDTYTVAAICGSASGNLVALDCDSHRAFDEMLDVLHDPETWIVKSQRGGHIYFRTSVPVRTRKASPELQILAQGNYVMAPGSLHPSGTPYQFIKQTPEIARLPSLTAIPGITLEPIQVHPAGMPRLAWRILTGQPTRRAYASDSEREMAAVCSMVNAGMSFERIHTAFVRLADSKHSHFGRWMTERGGQKNARDMLERMYRRALQFTAKDSPERAAAKHLRAWLLDHPLDGRTGTYDTCVLDALLQIALQSGSLTIAAGARELAERAGISKEAAPKATRRLIERGWLEMDTAASGRFSNIYRIVPQSKFGLQNLYTPSETIRVRECIGFATTENLFAADAFRWKGLGKSAALVCQQLTRGAFTLDEIARNIGRDKSTVSRALDRLYAVGAVEPSDLRGWAVTWRLAPDVNWSDIAHRLETAGAARRQKSAHDRQRETYRKRLERWQEEK